MAMRVEDLRYFEHLSKVLNFTRASKDLHISQPTLSLAVKRLEDEWGVQLLERNRATVELTDIGHDIVECISNALYDLDRAQTLAEESLGTENAVINLGTIHAMQGKFWSQALFDFRAQSSFDPQITVTQAYSRELLRRLRAGQLDVVICSRVGDMKGLQYSLCWSQSLVLGVNRPYLPFFLLFLLLLLILPKCRRALLGILRAPTLDSVSTCDLITTHYVYHRNAI